MASEWKRGSEKVAGDMADNAAPAVTRGAASRCRWPEGNAHLLSFVVGTLKRVRMDLAGKRIFHIGNGINAPDGPIAQLDRVTDFYSVGCRFESCWDRR